MDVKELNKMLVEHYSTAWNGWPSWRIVWSEDQFEKRYGTYEDYSSEGIYIRTVTEWREVPKYRQWIHEKYVLERLVGVDNPNDQEILSTKVSYEPIFTYQDKRGFPLPPQWEVTKFVIDTVLAAMSKKSGGMAKYTEDVSIEAQKKQIVDLEEQLFGNETEVADALAHKQAIVVPENLGDKNAN